MTAKQALLSLGAFVLALAIPELALRGAGFRFEPGVEFGWPRPRQMAQFAPDEKLFWKLRTADDPAPKNWSGNSTGFPGAEVVRPKPAHVRRILFLGDSCTFLGYPEITIERLNSIAPVEGQTYESVILAIPGYSSYQGLVAAELYGQFLEADIVVIFFGWNDHWAAYGEVDSKRKVHVPDSLASSLLASAVRKMRLLQSMNWIHAQITRADEPIGKLRVPPEEYAQNLTALQRMFSERGASIVFVTAPTSFHALGVPEYLIQLHFVEDGASAIRLHRAYNAIARETARSTQAALLDLETEAEARDDVATLFNLDGIHFTPAGKSWVGERLAELIASGEPSSSPR